MHRSQADRVKRLMETIAQAVGVSRYDSGILAESLIVTDIKEISTHGTSRSATFIRRNQKGLINPCIDIAIKQQRAAIIAVNADNSIGQVQAVLDLLVPMFRSTGCASATIRNSQHFRALSYFCNRAADYGMILLAMTHCEPSMPPAGAREAFFGTNPIAVSFPTGKDCPIKTDLATSVVACGNIILAKRQGKSVHEGWALDSDGNSTARWESLSWEWFWPWHATRVKLWH